MYKHKSNGRDIDVDYMETITYLTDIAQSMNNVDISNNIHEIINVSYLGQVSRYIYRLLKQIEVSGLDIRLDGYNREPG